MVFLTSEIREHMVYPGREGIIEFHRHRNPEP